MSSGSLHFENISFISEEDLNFAFKMSGSSSGSSTCSANLNVQPIRSIKATTRARAPRLLHGHSPLGLVAPILADDLAVVAQPARVLQLVSEEHRVAQPLTQTARGISRSVPCHWQTLKTAPPVELPSPTLARIRSMPRKRDTEAPLARCVFKDFQRKFYRRRVVELFVGQGITRCTDSRRSQFM